MRRRGLLPPAKRKKKPLLEWMGEYRPMLVAERPFDLEQHRYLRKIYADKSKEVVYLKAAQVGISEYMISWTLYMAAEQYATCLYVMPTDAHVSDFSTARLGPAIDPQVSPKLAALITPMTSGKRGADKVSLKRVGDRFVYFRGGQIREEEYRQRAAQLKSIDADALVVDELDEMDMRVLPIVRARLEHSELGRIRIASTPTLSDTGIFALYQTTTQHEWHLRCEGCNLLQPVRLENLVLEWDQLDRPLAWHGQDSENGEPFLACVKCHKPLDRAGAGQWVAAYASRPVTGYHILGLISPRKNLKEIIDGLTSINETKRQQTFNQGLGLAYKPGTSESISDAILDGCQRPYSLGPVPGEATFVGIDVGRVLNVVIRGQAEDGYRPLRFAGMLETFEEVIALLSRWKPRVVVVDALPETRKSRELQAAFMRLKVWLAYYPDPTQGMKTEKTARWNAREGEVDIDRTRAMDYMLAAFHAAATGTVDPLNQPGNTLPGGAKELILDYYAHLTAPARVMRPTQRGEKVPTYVATNPDHYAHAEVYCYCAYLCPFVGWSIGAAGD